MKKINTFNLKLIFGALILMLVIIAGLVFVTSSSFAALLDNDVRVEENSELTYYIDVLYDGKDSQAISSSDEATADLRSDYIYVEDKLPEGLVFKEFVNSGGDGIGAVERSDNKTACPGHVVDGYEGLSYNPDTNMVSFKVKGLQAGCKLTVGVVTMTPSLNGKDRMDFYNTAFARENNFSAQSNTVHVFMGKETLDTHKVIYEYTRDIPGDVNILPPTNSYSKGAVVGVAPNPIVDGYTFSGWSSNDVDIQGQKFIMPDNDVKLTGNFIKNESFYVSYRIDGDMPNDYKVPSKKEYSKGSDVFVDSLKKGDIVNGYRFLGWETQDVELVFSGEDYSFVMPDKNVELVGRFEKESYKVSYQFQGADFPPNANQLLPEDKIYYLGDKVKLAKEPVAAGYDFLGWYENDYFEMPNKDVIIYGEWSKNDGVFAPIIVQEIINPKDKYEKGDVVEFKITVTNNAPYTIYDVMLEGKYSFISGDNYILMNDKYVKIPVINAFQSASVYAQYEVKDSSYKHLQNNVKLVGAIADGNYFLDTSKEYNSNVSFITGHITLEVNKIDKSGRSLTGAEFGLYEDPELINKVAGGLTFSDLDINSTYYLKELKAPENYVLSDNVYEICINSSGNVSVDGQELIIKDDKYIVDIINEKQNFINSPDTIDSIIKYVILLIIFILIIVFVVHRLIKNKQSRKDNDKDKKLPDLLDL